ncbi:MAG: HlyC/CorC family transporter [Magnetococcales bacterium]|nr:HlyC/CorC family transporter [Magnetococcales bacterium]
MDDNILMLIAMFGCLVMEGFYAGSEIAVVSADRLKLRHDAAKGSNGARIALDMLQKPEMLLSTTLVGINVAIVTNSSLATLLAINLFGADFAWLAIVLIAPFIWVFGEIVPKSVFQQQADIFTPRIIYVLKASFYLFYPIIATFTFLSGIIAKILGGESGKSHFTLREELDVMLQMPASEGDVRHEEKTMIRRVFNFSETKVRDIMVPLIDVAAVDVRATCGQALRIASNSSHVRLLVYSLRVDQVVGMVNTFELLGLPDENPLKPHLKSIRFVPGSMGLVDLLDDFRRQGDRIAAVVDEYGSAQGVLTLEDIMERVVGKMQDEYDDNERNRDKITVLDAKNSSVSARVLLVTLKEEMGISLPEGNYETLAGFLLERWQRIPDEGESIDVGKYRFVVEKAHRKAVLQVRIERLD